jgi:hypothetical protein
MTRFMVLELKSGRMAESMLVSGKIALSTEAVSSRGPMGRNMKATTDTTRSTGRENFSGHLAQSSQGSGWLDYKRERQLSSYQTRLNGRACGRRVNV